MSSSFEFNSPAFLNRVILAASLVNVLTTPASTTGPDIVATSGEVVARTVHPAHYRMELHAAIAKSVCHTTANYDVECESAVKVVPVRIRDPESYSLTVRDCDIAGYAGDCVLGEVTVSKQSFDHSLLGSVYLPNHKA